MKWENRQKKTEKPTFIWRALFLQLKEEDEKKQNPNYQQQQPQNILPYIALFKNVFGFHATAIVHVTAQLG